MKDFFKYRETLTEGFRNSFPGSVWKEDPSSNSNRKLRPYDDREIYTLASLGADYAEYVETDARSGLQDMFDMYKLSKKKGPVYKGKFESMKTPIEVEFTYLSVKTIDDELGYFGLDSEGDLDYPGAKIYFFAFGRSSRDIYAYAGQHNGAVHDWYATDIVKRLEQHAFKYKKIKTI